MSGESCTRTWLVVERRKVAAFLEKRAVAPRNSRAVLEFNHPVVTGEMGEND